MRPSTSVPPPAANGTTIVTGRAGQACPTDVCAIDVCAAALPKATETATMAGIARFARMAKTPLVPGPRLVARKQWARHDPFFYGGTRLKLLGRRCGGLPMADVLDAAPETIEKIDATLNYINDNGEKLFTYTGGPGSLDVRNGGTPDPHRVTIRNGRPLAADFKLEQRRLPLRQARHRKSPTSSTRTRSSAIYYPEMEALVKAESGAKRVVVFDHTLRTADDELREEKQDPRGRAPRAQRLHRMVRAAARARSVARRGRRAAQAPLRHRPGVAADPPSGRDASRSRSATRRACRRTT